MPTAVDETLEMVLDSADGFLADRHTLERLRISRDAPQTAVCPEIWSHMSDLGWLGLGLPEAMGGPGLRTVTSAALCARLGRALLPEPLIAAALMPGALLAACPPSRQRDALAERLAAGDGALTIAWQERAGRLPPDQIDTTCESGLLSGSKVFVPLSLPDTTLIVLAQDAERPVLVTAPQGDDGVIVRSCRMGDGGLMAEVLFDNVRIVDPPLATGPDALKAAQRALDVGTVTLSAQLTGLAEGALGLCLDYLRTRSQFGKPIGTFQALQHRSVDLYMDVELSKAAWRRAAILCDQAPYDPTTGAAVSAAKTAATKAARHIGQAGVQIFGAMGFTEEADIGLYLRAALHLGSWLGGETVHRRRFLAATRGGSGA